MHMHITNVPITTAKIARQKAAFILQDSPQDRVDPQLNSPKHAS
jgi:hypothetical protein